MKLAFSTNAYTNGKFTIIDAINRIADAGYQGVEILADKPLVWPFDLKEKDIEKIRNTLEKRNIEVANVNGFTCSMPMPPGHNFGPCFCDYEQEYRQQRIEYTKKVIDFTAAIGGQDISTCSGILPKRGSKRMAWRNMINGLNQTIDYAKKKNVRINIEYEPGLLIGDALETSLLLKNIKSKNFGINFDIGHSFCCDEDVEFMIKLFYDKIHTVHIEDIGLDDKGRPAHYHLIPGQGQMPLKEIFRTFKKINYQGWYIVELYTMFQQPVKATVESMKFLTEMNKMLK